MCIHKALAKCKTQEERDQVVTVYKALVEAAKTKDGFCRLEKKHRWHRKQTPAGTHWLCVQCDLVSLQPVLEDTKLLAEVESTTSD